MIYSKNIFTLLIIPLLLLSGCTCVEPIPAQVSFRDKEWLSGKMNPPIEPFTVTPEEKASKSLGPRDFVSPFN